MTKLYDFRNKGSSGMKYQKGTSRGSAGAGGLCFGYSLIWAAKMQKAPDKPKLSAPDAMGAGPLQQKVEQLSMGWKESVQKVALDLGYSCGVPEQRVWDLLPAYCARVSGFHIVDIGDHWVGMGQGGNGWYFFDANDGLHEFADEASFSGFTVAAIGNYKSDPDPDNGFEMNHRAYKITI